MDTILTVVLVLACIAMIALSAILLYDLSKDIMEERNAAKRREELFKKWANMKLDKPCIYIDTDTTYKGGYIYSHNVWYKMRISCSHFSNALHVGRCTHPDIEPDIAGICACDFRTCPLLREEIGNDGKRIDY